MTVVTAGLLSLFLSAPAMGQRGALTRSRNLIQLVNQSAVILRGNVVSARVEPHPEFRHLSTVVVTVHVQEALKGDPGHTYTFRQYIWDIRDRYDAGGYRKGQQLLLLMNPPTRYGLSSPAGLDQGQFRILRDPQGRSMAVNGHANAGLFHNLKSEVAAKGLRLSPGLAAAVSEERAGPVPVQELEDFIRQVAGAR